MNKQTEAIKLAIEVFDGNWHDEIVDTEWADKANNAITVLREALAEQPAQQEHITDGSPCWCNPDLDYKDPETGVEVWIHKEPQ